MSSTRHHRPTRRTNRTRQPHRRRERRRVVDLFAGAGGWEEGLKLAGHTGPVVGLETDATACATAQEAGHARTTDVAAAIHTRTDRSGGWSGHHRVRPTHKAARAPDASTNRG